MLRDSRNASVDPITSVTMDRHKATKKATHELSMAEEQRKPAPTHSTCTRATDESDTRRNIDSTRDRYALGRRQRRLASSLRRRSSRNAIAARRYNHHQTSQSHPTRGRGPPLHQAQTLVDEEAGTTKAPALRPRSAPVGNER